MPPANNMPEEIYRRKVRAKLRFKAAVGFVMKNVYWLLPDEEKEKLKQDKILKTLKAYPYYYVTPEISIQIKYLMLKDLSLRTGKVKDDILKFVCNALPVFRGYPQDIKEKITLKSRYLYLPPDVTFMKMDSIPLNLYCLVAGRVSRSTWGKDPITGEPIKILENLYGPGTMFGEIALLNKIPQPYILDTRDHCDFLYINEVEYTHIISEIRPKWEEIRNYLKTLDYFFDWSDVQLLQCARKTYVHDFPEGNLILGDKHGHRDRIYLIVSGVCSLIHDLDLTTEHRMDKIYYRLDSSKRAGSEVSQESVRSDNSIRGKFLQTYGISTSNASLISKISRESAVGPYKARRATSRSFKKFFELCKMKPSCFFNVGEDFTNRRVVAISTVQVYCIPRLWILRQTNDQRWLLHKEFLEKQMPNDEEKIFEQFQKLQNWHDFCNNLMDPVMSKRKLTLRTTYHDIPYSCRVFNLY